MKTCTKCKKTKPVSEFDKSKNRKDGLYPYCKVCRKDYYQKNKARICELKEGKDIAYRARNRDKINARIWAYRKTVRGCLAGKYDLLKRRCKDRKEYIEKGIKNKFKNFEHFRSYVVEVLKVDPRGLDCHRIDDEGHYEPGNVAFIPHGEHRKIHAKK